MSAFLSTYDDGWGNGMGKGRVRWMDVYERRRERGTSRPPTDEAIVNQENSPPSRHPKHSSQQPPLRPQRSLQRELRRQTWFVCVFSRGVLDSHTTGFWLQQRRVLK